MTTILVNALYAMSGICAYAMIHHGLIFIHQRTSRINILFAVMCFMVMAYILAKARAYSAETAMELVTMRRWEISAACIFFVIFPWFVALYTSINKLKLQFGLSAFFVLIFSANLFLPFGIQFVEFPHITYFDLPWGENLVDLRVLQRSFWHNMLWLGVFITIAYSYYACRLQYQRGCQKKALMLACALFLFFGMCLFNIAVNLELINFVHLSEFGFMSLLLLLMIDLTSESSRMSQQLHEVFDHLPAAVFLKDLQGHYLLTNLYFDNFFHLNKADIIGKTDFDLFPRELAKVYQAKGLQALETGHEVEFEVEVNRMIDSDDRLRIIKVLQFPLQNAYGTSYALCGICIDLTESRRNDKAIYKLRQQLWHFDRLSRMGAITASLAHELCQPLSAILNNSQAGLRFIAKDKVNLEEIRAVLQDIVNDDKRAGAIIHGLHAMLQHKEMPIDDIDLIKTFEEVIGLMRNELIKLDINVKLESMEQLKVRANKTQVQQVILNLLMNAMDAMSEQTTQRTLNIGIVRAEDNALVSIHDNGVGIAEDMLERVFDGFYTTKPKGMGVGLEVCRSIVELHGGKIWAKINPSGRGVIFYFTLPLTL